MRDRLKEHCGLAIVLVVYVVVAVLYGVLTPIFETPDANGHYAYIHELTEGRGFPAHALSTTWSASSISRRHFWRRPV